VRLEELPAFVGVLFLLAGGALWYWAYFRKGTQRGLKGLFLDFWHGMFGGGETQTTSRGVAVLIAHFFGFILILFGALQIAGKIGC